MVKVSLDLVIFQALKARVRAMEQAIMTINATKFLILLSLTVQPLTIVKCSDSLASLPLGISLPFDR